MLAVALLRGINVGGKSQVPMAELRSSFEALGFADVATYINSGNVLFEVAGIRGAKQLQALAPGIEERLEADFGFPIRVVLRTHVQLRRMVEAIPPDWTTDDVFKTDVIVLRPEVDRAATLDLLTTKPGVDESMYARGFIGWRIERKDRTRTGLSSIIGSDVYPFVTIRNVTTIRKLLALLDARAEHP